MVRKKDLEDKKGVKDRLVLGDSWSKVVGDILCSRVGKVVTVSYTHLTLPTIYSV